MNAKHTLSSLCAPQCSYLIKPNFAQVLWREVNMLGGNHRGAIHCKRETQCVGLRQMQGVYVLHLTKILDCVPRKPVQAKLHIWAYFAEFILHLALGQGNELSWDRGSLSTQKFCLIILRVLWIWQGTAHMFSNLAFTAVRDKNLYSFKNTKPEQNLKAVSLSL